MEANGCGNCKHSRNIAGNLFCCLNPPMAFPVMGMNQNGPVVVGWTSSFPPVQETHQCSHWIRGVIKPASKPSIVPIRSFSDGPKPQ